MKGLLFSFICVAVLAGILSGCGKNYTVTTPVPFMNSIVNTNYAFNTQTVYPEVLKLAGNDTTVTLTMIGVQNQTKERVELQIKNFKGASRTYSIAAGEASAVYFHYVAAGSGLSPVSVAQGGQITISKVTGDAITGIFNFDTPDGYIFAAGSTFSCPNPGYVAHP